MFKGSCDLNSMFWYLERELPVDVIKDFHFFDENNFPIVTGHSQSIVDSNQLDENEITFLEQRLPFIKKRVYNKEVFDAKYDLLIFSAINDYAQNMYRYNRNNILVNHGAYGENLTNKKITRQF